MTSRNSLGQNHEEGIKSSLLHGGKDRTTGTITWVHLIREVELRMKPEFKPTLTEDTGITINIKVTPNAWLKYWIKWPEEKAVLKYLQKTIMSSHS